MIIATHLQAKELGYCNAGLRKWLEGRDLTYREFLLNGVSVEWLRAQNDAMATRLANYAEEKENGQ